MKVVSAATINEAIRPQKGQDRGEFAFVQKLVANGPADLVANADVSARALEFEGRLIPLILSDGDPASSTVCSIQAHYVESPGSQLPQLGNRFYGLAARPFLVLLGHIIRAGGLGKVLYLNDWLMTTNPEVRLNTSQLQEITRYLTSEFPERAIVVRSVNPVTRSELQNALLGSGFELIRSRRIYVFDPSRDGFKRKENLRKDLKLLRKWPGKIGKGALSEKGIHRVAELYRDLYLRKYSSGNPDFTERFFRTVINEEVSEFRYLELDGEILAFTAWKHEPDSMLGTLIGYDTELPQERGLLRMAFAIDFGEALSRNVPYHLSSGNGQFKRLRGCVPTTEYDAVFSRHLSLRKRTCWKLFRLLMKLAEKLEGEKIDFKKAPS
jgi:hypothetical protein